MEQLKVGIGADTKGLEKGLKDAEKGIKCFCYKIQTNRNTTKKERNRVLN